MKHYKIIFTLIVGTLFTLTSCDDDEKLNLQPYPENQPSISISNVSEGSELIMKAVYDSEGKIELDNKVSRTYLFRFKASPEDINLSYEVLSKNIPKEFIEISSTKDVIAPGYTDASVTITLKDEDFSFAQTNYDEDIYELGVRAYANGFKMPTEPIESKVIIKKEAYTAVYSVVGEEGSSTSIERAYSNGGIVNSEPASYSFSLQLDKPALKATKIKFNTTGLDEKFLNTVTVSPVEVTIPAGEKKSEVITWSIKDDFLLQTDKEESHTLTVIPISEEVSTVADKKTGIVALNISKVFRNFGYIEVKNPSWTPLSKNGWLAEIFSPATYGNAKNLINGVGGMSGSDVYTSFDNLSFIIDMAAAQVFSGLGVDYYKNGTPSSPRKVKISTSLDKVNWTSQGEINTPQSFNHYFKFFNPINARYVKFELLNRYNGYIDLTEIYMYN